MPKEIDDAWIEEAMAAYRRIEEKQASFSQALRRLLGGLLAVGSPTVGEAIGAPTGRCGG